MKIELNIDASQIGETVVEIFNNLNADQRKDIALTVMKNWLTEPYDIERKAYAQEAIRDMRKETDYCGNKRYEKKTDEEIMKEYEFTKRMNNHITAKEKMVKGITEEIIRYYKESVERFVREDEQVNRCLKETMEAIRKDFPNYVHDAMIGWFTSNLNMVAMNVSSALMMSENANKLADSIAQQINNQNRY